MMGPALGAPLQAVDWKLPGLVVDGNNGPGVVLLIETWQQHRCQVPLAGVQSKILGVVEPYTLERGRNICRAAA